MVRKKDAFWMYARDLGSGRFRCLFCNRDFAGGIARIKSHLSGIRGRDIQICAQVPQEVQLAAQKVIDTSTKRAKSVLASNNVLQEKSTSGSSSSHVPNLCKGGSSSSHVPNLCKGQDTLKLDKQLAKFIILERICFDAIQSPHFKDFVKCIAEHGPGYELPSSLTFKSRLIPDIKKEVEEYVSDVIKYSVRTGCTVMINRWTKKSSNTSISIFEDIFAYTPLGVVCIDIKPEQDKITRDIHYFEKAFLSVIELIGSTNVVQFIIDNDNDDDSDEVSVTKDVLYSNFPWIFKTPCATHEIELLWRKIYDVPFVYNTIEVAKLIVLYIYKYKVDVSLKRVHKKKDFIASQFFLLMSLLEVESELQALEVPIVTLSSDWGKRLNHEQLEELIGGAGLIDYVIHCKEFWNRGKMVAQVMQPLFQALCLVNCDAPTSGYLYEMMERVQDAVKKCFDNNHVLYDVICDILSEVRSDIILPIHVVAAFLNPIYMCSEKFKENDEMKNGVSYVLEHLVAEEEKEDFIKQVQLYRMKDSNLFTAQAMMMLKTSHPRMWWELCGNHLPILQKYAIQFLSQPCSSSLCKRFQLRDSYLDDRAFVVNAMMMERYKSLETQMIEPIILDKLGEVSDDVNYQHIWDEDDDWDNDYAYEFSYLTATYDKNILKDSTGSWLDRWPKKGMESSK